MSSKRKPFEPTTENLLVLIILMFIIILALLCCPRRDKTDIRPIRVYCVHQTPTNKNSGPPPYSSAVSPNNPSPEEAK